MLRTFNSMQFVAIFASMPYIINWLDSATFAYSGAAKWTAIISYIVMAIINITSIYNLSGRDSIW